jgi:hypothetical protein
VRQSILSLLREVGPHLGLEALRGLFPNVARCVLSDLLRRARRVWQRRYRRQGFRLEWHRPGAVWAIDFCDARYLMDGIYPHLFPVRDLASHRQLAWLPFRTQTAEETLVALENLFREHGCPLIIKCDNGSAFIAELFRDRLAQWGVVILYSPPRCPAYNGGLERSNGTHKTYTHQQAVSAGHPYRWTSHDTEQARHLSNTLARPWGHQGPTPEEAWQARTPLTADDRQQFTACLERCRATARAALGLDDALVLSRDDQARRDRLAVRDALTELGYLTMQRVMRPARKPKRRSREQLAARVARARSQDSCPSAPDAPLAAPLFSTPTTAAPAARAPAPSPAAVTLPAPVADATLDHAAPSDPPRSRSAAQKMLALAPRPDTMVRDVGEATLSRAASASETAQRGMSHTSCARRCLTLLLSFLKAARYSWW